MSWLKALSHSEDVFDEDADDLNLLNKEWNSNMKKRIRDGYVDGADLGEEASLQTGFNQGHKEGAAKTAAVGRLKGIVSAVSCWCQLRRPDGAPLAPSGPPGPPASVTELLLLVSRHEDAIMQRIKAELENPPPSVSSVSDGLEEMQVETGGSGGSGGSGCCGGGPCPDSGCCKQEDNMELDSDQHHQHQQLRLSPGSRESGSRESGSDLVQQLRLGPGSRESGSDLVQLLQRCVDLVSELGLPKELLSHILELENFDSKSS